MVTIEDRSFHSQVLIVVVVVLPARLDSACIKQVQFFSVEYVIKSEYVKYEFFLQKTTELKGSG